MVGKLLQCKRNKTIWNARRFYKNWLWWRGIEAQCFVNFFAHNFKIKMTADRILGVSVHERLNIKIISVNPHTSTSLCFLHSVMWAEPCEACDCSWLDQRKKSQMIFWFHRLHLATLPLVTPSWFTQNSRSGALG